MRSIKIFVLCVLALLLIVGGCGKKEKSYTIKIKISSPLSEAHPSSEALVFFKDRLAEVSGGKVYVDLFFNGQLAKSDESVEATQAGTIEAVFMSVAILTQYEPELNVLCMPFIFRDSEHAYAVVDGPIGEALADKLRAINLHTLSYCDAGSRNIMTKKGPVVKPKDLKGMKIRVMNSQLMIDSVNGIGAAAMPMDMGEVYTSLQTGVLDGWENNSPTTLSFRMYETGCIHYARTEHLMIPDMLLINKEFYDGLDEVTRGQIDSVAKEFTAKQRQLWASSDEVINAKLVEEGMKFNEVEKELFIKLVDKVYKKYYKKYGKDFEELCKKIKAVE